MVFVLAEPALRRQLAGANGAEELQVAFAAFIGMPAQGTPQPENYYFPALAAFCLPEGRQYGTFDHYWVQAGVTALIYPVYRTQKSVIQRVLFNQAIPAIRDWLDACVGSEKAGALYVLHDPARGELVWGVNRITSRHSGGRLQLTERSRVVATLSGTPQRRG